MRIIIEEHQYPADAVRHVLDGITTLRDIEGKVSVNYVGYYYNPTLKDTVFILPKVLLGKELDKTTGEEIPGSDPEFVFGKYKPEDIINLDDKEAKTLLTQEEHDFIYELSVWIYRAIVVFRDSKTDNSIVLQQNVQQMSKGRLQRAHTFLDVILALQKFNRENQDFFFFILRNLHSGMNKINWTKTISRSQAFVQNGSPIYINPVNKKRQINFDEELLIIYFSILNHIHEAYGFPVKININFPLITSGMFRNYMNGMGRVRLLQIKYKYFSDKALYLWELCYAFFDRSKNINVETDDKEYLLVKNFNIVFETIIDTLIGDQPTGLSGQEDKALKALKEQKDGKRVDHIFRYKELSENANGKNVYYIGDSKYYKRSTPLGDESIYKQFTYARNVIQWNIDLFNDKKKGDLQAKHTKLRDDVTEGYNIIPNFFISAHQNTLDMKDDIHQNPHDGDPRFCNKQFENRLFDRDTFLLAHYDVNFLFVVALYGRNRHSEQEQWAAKVKGMFRNATQELLKKHYEFYAMKARSSEEEGRQFILDNFKDLIGKIYRPYEDQEMFSLAIEKPRPDFDTKCDPAYQLLSKYFEIEKVTLGECPQTTLDEKIEAYRRENAEAIEEHEKVVLVGVVNEDDKNFMAFLTHEDNLEYTMKSIPSGNIMNLKYFAPFLRNKIDGYYKIEKLSFGSRGGKPCLNLTIKDFTKIGNNPKHLGIKPHNDIISLQTLRSYYEGEIPVLCP